MPIPQGLAPTEYFRLIRNSIVKPRFKFEFLNPDLTTKFEVIEDFTSNSGTINIKFPGETGVRRTCSVVLSNIEGQYLPNPNGGFIWVGSMFRLSLGIASDDGTTYWSPNGVYVVSDPVSINARSNRSITVNGTDKWANLNNDLGGEVTETYEIPLGTNVYTAIQAILDIDKGNGASLDGTPPIFDSINATETTSYTIREEQGGSYANLITKLCENIASYAYYNEFGQLVVESGTRDLGDNLKPSLYNFNEDEAEILSSTVTYQFNKIRNSIRVVGMNINGNIASGLAENTNPASSTRISLIGRRKKLVKVDTIDDDTKALAYANLLLKTESMLNVAYNITATYMTHLDVNNVITTTSNYYGFEQQRFLVQSISIPLSIGAELSIMATNISDLPFS